jgi:hypothetical protein
LPRFANKHEGQRSACGLNELVLRLRFWLPLLLWLQKN